MQSSIEKLRKFFRLENENGYQNKAVIGGLAKILEFWEAEARNETVSEDIISLVSARLRDYHRLTPTSRAETLKGLWKRIQGQAGAGEIPEPIFTENEPERKPVPAKAINTPEKSSASAQPQRSEAPQREPYRPPQQREQQERKVAPRSSSFPGAQTSQTPAALNASLTVLHGVGPKNSSKLEKLGLYTLGDMLYFFPRRYDDYSKLKPIKALFYGDVVTVIGQVQSVSKALLTFQLEMWG